MSSIADTKPVEAAVTRPFAKTSSFPLPSTSRPSDIKLPSTSSARLETRISYPMPPIDDPLLSRPVRKSGAPLPSAVARALPSSEPKTDITRKVNSLLSDVQRVT